MSTIITALVVVGFVAIIIGLLTYVNNRDRKAATIDDSNTDR